MLISSVTEKQQWKNHDKYLLTLSLQVGETVGDDGIGDTQEYGLPQDTATAD